MVWKMVVAHFKWNTHAVLYRIFLHITALTLLYVTGNVTLKRTKIVDEESNCSKNAYGKASDGKTKQNKQANKQKTPNKQAKTKQITTTNHTIIYSLYIFF